jgi:hypothetical protein
LERFFHEFRTKSDEIGAFPNEPTYLTAFHSDRDARSRQA